MSTAPIANWQCSWDFVPPHFEVHGSNVLCPFNVNGDTPLDYACQEQQQQCTIVDIVRVGTEGDRIAVYSCPDNQSAAPEVPFEVQEWVKSLNGNLIQQTAQVQIFTHVGVWHLEQIDGIWNLVSSMA